MRMKALCLVILLSSIHGVRSQDSIRLILEFKMVHVVDITQPTNTRISPCMLLVGTKRSVFDDYYRSLRYLGYRGIATDRIYDDPNDIQDAVSGVTSDQIYTDFDKQTLITGSYFWNTLYTKSEPLPSIDWTIQSQKKKILDQECQMATATFKGRHYTAWFAPSIPVNAGPWKLNGLPGIILAANDDKNEISFTCTKLTMPEKNAPRIVFAKNATLISAEKFEITRKAFIQDPKAGMALANPAGTLMAVTVSPGAAASQTKNKRRSLNNPIEKE